MHLTHDRFQRYQAQDRAMDAERRAAAHRLRVAAGTDFHARAVRALSAALERHRVSDDARRDAASAEPRRTDGSGDLVTAA